VRPSRAIVFWLTVIAVLVFVEVAELTRLFTLPVQSAIANLLSFIFALVFTTILALVGAVFIGIYIANRLQSPTGFTPFEEEMLRMRADLEETRATVEAIRAHVGAPPAAPSPGDPKGRP